MIVYYSKEFNHEDLVKKQIKNEKFRVLTQKNFDNYKSQVKEERNEDVKVAFNTKLSKVDTDSIDENKNYLFIGSLCFELTENKSKKAKYYIPIDELTFVRVEAGNMLPLILLITAGILTVGISLFILKPELPDIPGITLDDSAEDGEGEMSTPDSDEYQENTVIPGYAEVTASKDAALIPLSNPEENTVNFVYTILVKKSEDVDKTFNKQEDAVKYVEENKKDYTNYKDGNSYQLKDQNGDITKEFVEYALQENGKKTEVVKTVYEVVYFSEGIAPGKHIDWNCYEYLGTGDFETQFRIATYDVETSTPCYGATQPVHIVIK